MQHLSQRSRRHPPVSRGEAVVSTQSTGTSSVAVLVWLNNDVKFAGYTERAMAWLASRCSDGAFGSTQGTVLALKAIIAYDVKRARPPTSYNFTVSIDGEDFATATFDSKSEKSPVFPDFASKLTPGEHTATVSMAGSLAWTVPYSVYVEYSSDFPASSPSCEVELSVAFGKTDLAEGEITSVSVTVANKKNNPQGMVVAIIGLPGGMQADLGSLQQLVASRAVSAFELWGPSVVLYWRGMAPLATQAAAVAVAAVAPGEYVAPASSAYAYYAADDRHWVQPPRILIRPAAAT
eukprot:TRINITY_DN464_c0_g1_i17.p1 TRINITY_DN464_c0_g1~~TRINITY_DN464_c0_g1_i17.p1  ORF type:complete len:293 (+),score=105.73 TRINITY_DN464_c0_g1_i17:63-941(+)